MFRGSIVALITPMHGDHSIDWTTLERLVEWHIEQGSHGIVPVGTTGESATLSMAENIEMFERVVAQVDGRLPVIAGAGANSTSEATQLTLAAEKAGADGALLVTPYYNKPTQEGLYLHYTAVAEATRLPIVLYNVPGRTACDLLPSTVARLAAVDNIVGIKEATGDIDRMLAIKALVDEDFALISGDDETALAFMEQGGHGVISVTANIAPAAMAKMCELVRSAKVEQARQINQTLMGLHKELFVESNPIPVKWAAAQLGFGENVLRLPLTPLSAEHHPRLAHAMNISGLD